MNQKVEVAIVSVQVPHKQKHHVRNKKKLDKDKVKCDKLEETIQFFINAKGLLCVQRERVQYASLHGNELMMLPPLRISNIFSIPQNCTDSAELWLACT